MLRDEIINKLRNFEEFTAKGLWGHNSFTNVYVVEAYMLNETLIALDTTQGDKPLYFNNNNEKVNDPLLEDDYKAERLDIIREAYNLYRDYKEQRIYMQGMINILKEKQKTKEGAEACVSCLGGGRRLVKLFFDSLGKLSFISRYDDAEFFNPINLPKDAKVRIYLEGASQVQMYIKDLTKQEVSQ